MGPRTENLPYGMIHLSTTGARALVFCSTHRRCPIIATTNNPYMPKGPVKDNDDLVNGKIRFPEVLLIDETGNSLGIKSRNEALRYARDKNSITVRWLLFLARVRIWQNTARTAKENS